MLFAVVAIGGLVVGLLLPKTWECSALLVPDATTIKRLMEGGGNAENHLATTIQAVQTRKIMNEVLTFGGWLNGKPSPQEEERLLARLRSRLRIENNTRENTIRISYRDNDPKRTFLITNKMVEIMIREAASAKETSSRETYEFVEGQVKAYGGELTVAHEKLLAYYRNQDAPATAPESDGPAGETSPGHGDSRHSARISIEELAKLRAEEATLAAQLARARSGPSSSGESRRAEEQLRARVEQLRFEYERLASSYTERHPDVVRKANDLEAARQELRRMEAARVENDRAVVATAALDEQVASAARVRLEELRARIEAGSPNTFGRSSRHRPSTMARPSAVTDTNLVDPDMRHVGQDSKLSELLSRYETTRDVYQDLLKKRETARLSMNLDLERGSVTLRVQEPARMPVIASGLRVMYKSLIGLVLAAAVPLGLLVALVSFDGRVRSPDLIERLARVPILVTIPYAPSSKERSRARLRRVFSVIFVAGVFAAYVVAFLLNQTKVRP